MKKGYKICRNKKIRKSKKTLQKRTQVINGRKIRKEAKIVGYPGFEKYFFEQELDDLDETLYGGGWDIIVDGYRYYFDFDGMDYHGQMADSKVDWEDAKQYSVYYDTLEELIEGYVFANGLTFKELWEQRTRKKTE